jgi:hypothetical protein
VLTVIGWMQSCLPRDRLFVLNGIPGHWISCHRGLCQGDPLFPYLFSVGRPCAAKLIQSDGVLEHPLVDGAQLVVLQYIDDMVVHYRVDAAAGTC